MNAFKTSHDLVEAVRGEIARLSVEDGLFRVERKNIRGISLNVYPNAPKTLRDLYTNCPSFANDTFLVFGKERYTFAETYQESNRLAGLLQSKFGIGPGDHVAIAMRNLPEWVFSFMAITSIGAVAVALNSWWQQSELEFALKDCRAKLCIADSTRISLVQSCFSQLDCRFMVVRAKDRALDNIEYYETLMDQAGPATVSEVPINPDDVATLFYTSGSSGSPKGVLSDHQAIISALMIWSHVSEATTNLLQSASSTAIPPATIQSMPLFHVAGAHSLFLYSLVLGRKLVFVHKWDVDTALRLIEEEKITFLNGAPAMIMDLLSTDRAGHDLSSLTMIGAAGAAMPSEYVRDLQKYLPAVVPQIGYGMTETNSVGALHAAEVYFDRPESAGLVNQPIVEMRIIDEFGNDVPQGTAGEILIRSVTNFRGYWNDPELTASVLRDGWLYTGDIGRFDQDGFLYIVDRKKDIIIRGGENISCLEVEAAISELDGIREVAVFAIPHKRLGETVAVVIYPEPTATLSLEGLRNALETCLAGFKLPERLFINKTPLPRSAAGKIAKRQLQNRYS